MGAGEQGAAGNAAAENTEELGEPAVQEPEFGAWESDSEADDLATLSRLAGPAPVVKGKKRQAAAGKDAAAEAETSTDGVSRPKTVIYVSGLPTDRNTEEELAEFFSKRCGILKIDFETGKPKLKLYRTAEGFLKGDAWISFLRPESVQLALQLTDGAEYRPGYQISVKPAEFPDKGEPKKKKKVDKKKVKLRMMQLNKKLEWFDEGAKASKYDKIVIFKNMFTAQEMEEDPGLLLDLKADLRSECEKLGDVTNVSVFDKHPDGICSVKFKDTEAAAACVELMNGRFFAKRKLEVFLYDGKTRYDQVNTDDVDEETRLKRYGDWLEGRDTSAAAVAAAKSFLQPAAASASAVSGKRKQRADEEDEDEEDEQGADPDAADGSGSDDERGGGSRS